MHPTPLSRTCRDLLIVVEQSTRDTCWGAGEHREDAPDPGGS